MKTQMKEVYRSPECESVALSPAQGILVVSDLSDYPGGGDLFNS